MEKFSYSDKRDLNGWILGLLAYAFDANMSNAFLRQIMKYGIYKELISFLDVEFVEMYFNKYFFENFEDVAHKFMLYKWYMENSKSVPIEFINIPFVPWHELLEKEWPESSVPFKIRNKFSEKLYYEIRNILKVLRNNLVNIYLNKALNGSYKKHYSKNKSVIAAMYDEGISLDRRSDIFWFHGSDIDPSSVLIYATSKYELNRYDKSNVVIDHIEKIGFGWAGIILGGYNGKITKWFNRVDDKYLPIKKIRGRFESILPEDEIECWLKKEALSLLNKVSFWCSFFESENVKIHYDSTEYGLDNIAKNVALEKLGGCSVGKVRSYPTMGEYGSLAFNYPNHIFFAYGKDSAKRYLRTNNCHRNILISGYPYGPPSETTKKNITSASTILKNNGAKFVLLLLDDMHSMNDNEYYQSIYTPTLVKFYELFLRWLLEDEEVGIIIKSKKNIVIENISDLQPLLKEADLTGRSYVIKDPLGHKSSDWAPAADFTVAISSSFSGALIDSVLTGCRGIFYDYPGYCKEMHGQLPDKNAEVIISDLKRMEKALKEFKMEPTTHSHLGDWSSYLDQLDPFRDGRGGERIGTYMRWLQEGFDMALAKDATINRANELYAQEWGEDKVYYTQSIKNSKISVTN